MLNQNFFWVLKLPLTALGCYDTNVRLFTCLNNKLFSLELKILNYDDGKTKNSRMKNNVSIGQNWFMDIDWLILVDSLTSVCFTQCLTCLTIICNNKNTVRYYGQFYYLIKEMKNLVYFQRRVHWHKVMKK